MSTLIPFSKEELSFSNQEFWWFYLVFSFPYATDHDLEMNFDEVLEDNGYTSSSRFNNRLFETIAGNRLPLEIEYLEDEISYYLNGFNIANISGHSNIAFLTWNELLRFSGSDDLLFFLLLPVSAIEEDECGAALPLIAEQLKRIGIKDDYTVQLATCLLNGLTAHKGNFEAAEDIGIVSHSNHSLRNYNRYKQYEDGDDCQQRLIRLNKLLSLV